MQLRQRSVYFIELFLWITIDVDCIYWINDDGREASLNYQKIDRKQLGNLRNLKMHVLC